VGKPSPLMIDYLADKYGVQRNRVCMVGDRLDTDVVFGNSNGWNVCVCVCVCVSVCVCV
jgi:ribonucleotide monophosphatase NagD (HAD superfamily)